MHERPQAARARGGARGRGTSQTPPEGAPDEKRPITCRAWPRGGAHHQRTEVRNVLDCAQSAPEAGGCPLTRTSKQGANKVAFSGRIGSKALRPGRYQATLSATDAARNSSKPKTITFRVVKK